MVDGSTEEPIDALFYLESNGSAGLTINTTKDLDRETSQFVEVSFFAENFELNKPFFASKNIDYHNGLSEGECRWIDIDTSLQNSIIITHLDSENQTISGTFEYTCREDECDETVVISEGRFDVQYRQ